MEYNNYVIGNSKVILTEQTLADINVLSRAFEKYNSIEFQMQSDYNKLQDAIKDFNFSQKYYGCKFGNFTNSSEILHAYKEKGLIVRAKIICNKSNKKITS